MLKAWKLGGQTTQQALLAVLFKGYFEELANIGDTNVLADMAVAAEMMTKDEVRRELFAPQSPIDHAFIIGRELPRVGRASGRGRDDDRRVQEEGHLRCPVHRDQREVGSERRANSSDLYSGASP